MTPKTFNIMSVALSLFMIDSTKIDNSRGLELPMEIADTKVFMSQSK